MAQEHTVELLLELTGRTGTSFQKFGMFSYGSVNKKSTN